jgi:hypothetical protein
MADETIEIDVDINTNTGDAEDSFTRLQTQIRETRTQLQAAAAAGDQVKFTKLKSELDGLEDSLEIVNLKQRQFDDALAAAPGPIGKAGQAIKGFDGTLKLLAANPIVAILAGLAAVLTAVVTALSKTKEGTAALTAVTDAFGNILTPIVNFISAVATPVVEAFADGINYLARVFGLVDEKQVAAQEAFRATETTIKQTQAALEGEIALLEAQGAAIDKTAAKKKQQIDNEINLLNLKKQAFGQITADEEAKIIELENKKKVIDAQVDAYNKKKAEERFKVRQDQFKKDIDAFDFSQKSRLQVQQKYFDDEKFALQKAFAEQIITEDQYKQQVFDLQKNQNEVSLLEQDIFLKARETKLREGLQKGLITQTEFDTLVLQKQTETTAAKDAIVKTGYDQEISYIEDAAKALLQLQDVQLEINANIAQSWIDLGGTIGNTFGQLANLFEKGSAAQKIFGIASVVINGAAAVGKVLLDSQQSISEARTVIAQGVAAKAKGAAIAPLNPIIGGALIATGIAASTTGASLLAKAKLNAGFQIAAIAGTSAAQIAAISSAGKNKNAGAVGANAAGAAGAGGGGTVSITGPTISAPQIGATANQAGTIADIVGQALDRNNSQLRPVRAYVVGNDITTQQQLDRRIRTAARLGG